MNYLGQTEYDSVADIDEDIEKYQEHIVKLNKIVTIGSPAGKGMAVEKLVEVKKNLSVLMKKRERFMKEAGLSGFGNCGSCGGNCACMRKAGGLGGFDGTVGNLMGNITGLAIVSVCIVAWLIQQSKDTGAALDDGIQWYDVLALPTHAVMVPLGYVADMIGP